MKKVILSESEDVILAFLTGRETVAYLATEPNTPKLLVKLTGGRHDQSPEKWGFISLAYPTNDDVEFMANTFHESAKKALMAGRSLMMFDKYIEFRTWAYSQKINK